VVTRLEDVSSPVMYACYLACDDPQVREMLHNFASRWRHIQPMVDGYLLRRRGLPPGPVYRQILGTLRKAWLDGKISTPEQEAQLLDELLAGEGIVADDKDSQLSSEV
jgi:tRNA nucleotidyltransferase (CCA-adding enzyme)